MKQLTVICSIVGAVEIIVQIIFIFISFRFSQKYDALRSKVLEINHRETRDKFLSYTKQTQRIPVESIFVPLEIKEDTVFIKDMNDLNTPFTPRYGKRIKLPQEMFYQNGHLARYIFLTGPAAHGKSVYCLWIVSQWCISQNAKGQGKELSEMEQALAEFDYVFLIRLKDVDRSRKTVEDLICHDVFMNDGNLHRTIRHVLCSDQYRCMIILDGLDEWKPNDGVLNQLAVKGMPSVENISRSILIITSRFSKVVSVKGILRDCDRVFEVHGISENNIEKLIDKVIFNCYREHLSNADFLLKSNQIKEKARKTKLKTVLKIPLFAILFAQMMYESKANVKSTTMLMAEMIDILIRRSSDKHEFCSQKISNKVEVGSSSHLESSVLRTKEKLINFIHVASSLTLFALDGVLEERYLMTRKKETLRDQLGNITLRLGLESGLLDIGIDPSGESEDHVHIRFLHKTVQEFLSSICILTNDQKNYAFPRSIAGVKKIENLSNVVMFICGINPIFGCSLSKQIAETIYADPEVSESRLYAHTVDERQQNRLYRLEMDLHHEIECSIGNAYDQSTQVYLSNIHVDYESNEEIVRNAVRFLTNTNLNILSLQLYRVPTEGEVCIYNEVLINHLNLTTSRRSLHLNGWSTNRCIEKIMISNLRECSLYNISIRNSNLSIIHDSCLLPYFTNMPKLQRLEISNFHTECMYSESNSTKTLPFMSNLPKLELMTLKNITVHKSNSHLITLNEYCSFLCNLEHLREVILDQVVICQENPDVLYSRDIPSMLPNIPDPMSSYRTPSQSGTTRNSYQQPLLLNTPISC